MSNLYLSLVFGFDVSHESKSLVSEVRSEDSTKFKLEPAEGEERQHFHRFGGSTTRTSHLIDS